MPGEANRAKVKQPQGVPTRGGPRKNHRSTNGDKLLFD